jgi:hypothetical protein
MRYTSFGIGHPVMLRSIARACESMAPNTNEVNLGYDDDKNSDDYEACDDVDDDDDDDSDDEEELSGEGLNNEDIDGWEGDEFDDLLSF